MSFCLQTKRRRKNVRSKKFHGRWLKFLLPKIVVNRDRVALNRKMSNRNVRETFTARIVSKKTKFFHRNEKRKFSALLEPFFDHRFSDDVRSDAVNLFYNVGIRNESVNRTKLKSVVAKQNNEMSRFTLLNLLKNKSSNSTLKHRIASSVLV